jgi:flavin-dependent dehydrogenase
MAEPETDVLVCGGGPAGAATAILLRQQGVHVILLDEARFPRDKICGEGISPDVWGHLERIGARDAVRRLAPHPLRGMALTAPDGTSFQGDYRAGAEPGFAVRRLRLDAVLLQVARDAGVDVREEWRVSAPIIEAGRVVGARVVHAVGTAELHARVVVAADGRRSAIARKLHLLRPHRFLHRFAVRGHWEGMQGLGERGEMHVVEGGYCGIAPLSASAANVAFVLDQGEMRAAAGDLEGFYRTSLRLRWPRLAERLGSARLLEPPKAIGPLAIEARQLVLPGLLLVGDAAGFYDPFTGEGVALALRGAGFASEAVLAHLRSDAPLASYERRLRAATRDKFRLNRALQMVVGSPWLANAVAHRLSHRPRAADRLVAIAGDFEPARTALSLGFVADLLF